MNNMENKNDKDKQPDNIFRRLPKNFKLPEYLSDEQKEKIINAIKRNIPIIITGVQGKTGKTYLNDYLNSLGVIAYELWECEVIELNVFI
jgi:hypothetical protein